MKHLIVILLCFFCILAKAQTSDFEIKVVSKKYQTVKGLLKKVSIEGIGVEDYKGNYLTFRPSEITRLKIRKRGLTVGEGSLAGLGGGAGLGAAIWSLDENGMATKELLTLTAALAGTGLVAGTITGIVAEIVNTKYTLTVNESDENYKVGYKKLEKYVNDIVTEHVNP
ncbi:MAG: hypothetical protein EOO91_08035 [Pedobacter sp.]|nr:MAG: hypothetical protein EOO91_08035 [Pedobacter sp.]